MDRVTLSEATPGSETKDGLSQAKNGLRTKHIHKLRLLDQRTENLPLFTRPSDPVLQVISGDFYLQKMQCNIQFIDFVILSRFLLNPLNFQI